MRKVRDSLRATLRGELIKINIRGTPAHSVLTHGTYTRRVMQARYGTKRFDGPAVSATTTAFLFSVATILRIDVTPSRVTVTLHA